MALRKWHFNGEPGLAVTRARVVAEDGTEATAGGPGEGITEFTGDTFEGSTALLFRGAGTGAPQVFRLPFAGSSPRGYVLFHHYAPTAPPVTYSIVNVRHASGQLFRITVAANGAVAVQTGSGGQITGTAAGAWQPGRWNRIEILFDNSLGAGAGAFILRAGGWDLDGQVEIGSTAANLGTAEAVSMDLGTPQQSSSTWEHIFDVVWTDDGAVDFAGPAARAANMASVGNLSVEQFEAAPVGFGAGTFSYYEERRKNFGPDNPHRARDLMPFYLQTVPTGVHIVRYPDGVISPVEVVTEELEAIEGIRIYYGGRENPVTEEEADELTAAGYGDYLTVVPEDAYNQGAYGEGDYGA